jgi:hypothetical protein
LRGNDLARNTYDQLPLARDLYLQCVEQDPGFAPAWAQLGRSHMIIGKYIEDPAGNYERSEKAFQRALELSHCRSRTSSTPTCKPTWGGRGGHVTLLEQASRHGNARSTGGARASAILACSSSRWRHDGPPARRASNRLS